MTNCGMAKPHESSAVGLALQRSVVTCGADFIAIALLGTCTMQLQALLRVLGVYGVPRRERHGHIVRQQLRHSAFNDGHERLVNYLSCAYA
jgi:hypothetical protein